MKARKHIFLLVFLSIYAVAMGIYEYKVNHAALNDVLLTLCIMAVIMLLLFFILRKKDQLRELHQLEDETKAQNADFDDEDPDEDKYRLPKDEK